MGFYISRRLHQNFAVEMEVAGSSSQIAAGAQDAAFL
jgi:hypothetical protein